MLKNTPEFKDAPPPPDKIKGPPPPPSNPKQQKFPFMSAVIADYIVDICTEQGDRQQKETKVAEVIDEALTLGAQKKQDIRLFLLEHPDRGEVTRACLHFLGDEAQAWWEARQKSQNPADLDDF